MRLCNNTKCERPEHKGASQCCPDPTLAVISIVKAYSRNHAIYSIRGALYLCQH